MPVSKIIQISLTFSPWIKYWVLIAVLYLLIPLKSYASELKTITTPHFAFHFHSQDERVMKTLIDEAESLRWEIMKDLGFDFKEITKVYLAPSFKKFLEIQPGGKIQSWAVGVAYPSLNLIIILSPRALKMGHMDLRKVFKHEFTHIALGRAFKGREEVPRWLHEGLAMYESREWDFSRVSTITRAVLTDSLIPLSDITHRFPQEGGRAELSYSESFYLISFFLNEFGVESFHQFIKQYSGGKSLNEVLMDVYGMSCDELEERWHSYLKMKFSWIPIVTSTTTLWFLVTIIFIIGFLRKRKAKRLKYEQWEREELDP